MDLGQLSAHARGLTDVIGGRVQVIIDGPPSLAGAINGGQLKLIAVGSAKRLPNRPETPTIAETLPNIPRALGWFALMGRPARPSRSPGRSATICATVLTTGDQEAASRTSRATSIRWRPRN